MKKLYKIIISLSILSAVILPIHSLAEAEKPTEAPETIEEAGSFMGNFVNKIPQAFGAAWEKAKEIWAGTWVKWWNESIKPWGEDVWREICRFFGQEVEERKPLIKEEFEKEKQEMKEDLAEETARGQKTLWEWVKELLKNNL
ncbi:MAG: hypothetical protein ABH919_02355 [bacterium]